MPISMIWVFFIMKIFLVKNIKKTDFLNKPLKIKVLNYDQVIKKV